MDFYCMEPVALPHVVQGDFIHQVKWDGIRGVTMFEDKEISVFSKSGRNVTAAYAELSVLKLQLDAKQAVIDGELVAFVNGKPSFFHALKRRRVHPAAAAAQEAIRYIVFDLLMLDGQDLRAQPIEQRQMLLKARFTDSATAALADSFDDGNALFALIKEKNMEGIVSKRRGSCYTAGKRHRDWFKTKTAKKMLCAVIGVHFNGGQAASLMLGIYREGVIVPVGHVGIGLSQSDLRRIGEYARREGKSAGKNDVILKPMLTCWVRFAEWTPSLTLRHPVMLGFADNSPEEACGEEISV